MVAWSERRDEHSGEEVEEAVGSALPQYVRYTPHA